MLWPAPFRGDKKVSARVVIPGSKSVTNRALILAAQATSHGVASQQTGGHHIGGVGGIGVRIGTPAWCGDAGPDPAAGIPR